mmetsp:Transcript_11745/g.30134  ORF Transcript_11745/g.30134 Transcript_11745/m.30134 type:complete len:209 (+) Transcript_11745:414-1040(+)
MSDGPSTQQYASTLRSIVEVYHLAMQSFSKTILKLLPSIFALWPVCLLYITLFPVVMSTAFCWPLVKYLPAPTATTSPANSSSSSSSASAIPVDVSFSASATATSTRSAIGVNDEAVTFPPSNFPSRPSASTKICFSPLYSTFSPVKSLRRTRSPSETGFGMSSPLSAFTRPGPEATTMPSLGFSVSAVGTNSPPPVFSSSLRIFTST